MGAVDTGSRLRVPSYLLDHDDPANLFTRLQRVGIHLELLQHEAMRGLDLAFRDFVILATLRKEPPPHALPVSRVAEYVLRPMGSITQAVDRIDEAGFVARTVDADDRRKGIVSLTPSGKALADRSLAAYDAVRKRVFAGLDSTDLESIDEAITTLLVALDADHEERAR